MKYVSLDLETSSLQPDPAHILGIAMVLEDTDDPKPLLELPRFVCMIDQGTFTGQPYALAMNAWILREIENFRRNKPAKYPVYLAKGVGPSTGRIGEHGFVTRDYSCWIDNAEAWLEQHVGMYNGAPSRTNLAGKNVGSFDFQFLPQRIRQWFRHRMIDPGSVFIDWNRQAPPSLDEIKQARNIPGLVSHDMYEDALDTISVLRTAYQRGEA